jgi:hypothetical protein
LREGVRVTPVSALSRSVTRENEGGYYEVTLTDHKGRVLVTYMVPEGKGMIYTPPVGRELNMVAQLRIDYHAPDRERITAAYPESGEQ